MAASLTESLGPRNHPVQSVLGLIFVTSALLLSGLFSYDLLGYSLADVAGWMLPAALLALLALSQRRMGGLRAFEIGSIVFIGIMWPVIYFKATPVYDLYVSTLPQSGAAFVVASVVATYILATHVEVSQLISRHPIQIGAGILVLVSATVLTGIGNIDVLTSEMREILIWSYPLAVIAAFLVSRRELGTLTGMELLATMLVGGLFIGLEHFPNLNDFIIANNPVSGVAVTVLALVTYVLLSADNGLLNS